MKDLRSKSRPELLSLIEDLKAELFMLRFRNSTNQLKETHKISIVKKDIAKVFTVLNSTPNAKPSTPRQQVATKKKVAKVAKRAATKPAQAKESK